MAEHILIIRFSALGDVAMLVPVVRSLAHQYPDVRITVLSRGFARPFFVGLSKNIAFIEADLRNDYRGLQGLNRLYRELKEKDFTAVADMHGVLRSNYLRMRFNLSGYKVAHIDKHRAGKRRLVAQSGKVLIQQPTTFQNYADVLERLGYPVKLEFRSIFPEGGGNLSLLPSTIGEKKQGEKWIGIAPFAAHEGKIYPLERMEEVVKGLVEKDAAIRLFFFGAGAQEKEVLDRWCTAYPRCVNASSQAAGLFQELIVMSHLDVMVSMDSANMHFASLVDTSVVSVWGATHPYAGFMGWGQSLDNAVQKELECRPCSIYGNKSCHRHDMACMNTISPDDIINKVMKNMK